MPSRQPVKASEANRLKRLTSQRHQLAEKVARMSTDRHRDQAEFRQACEELAGINRQIEKVQGRRRVMMTEHAILRYLERAMGVDLDEICRKVLTPELQLQVEQLGDGRYPIGDGIRVQVVDKTIVTVIDK